MDLHQEIRSFTPIDIEKYTQSNEVSEKIIDSVKSYNKAIEYLKTGSEDIAMIELKKVVSTNPDFYEAVNLLGLCYVYTNQIDKAEALFGKVIQGENNAIKAADYLNYININDNISSKKNNKTKNVQPANRQTKKTINKPTKIVKEPITKENFSDENVQTEYLLLRKIRTQLKKPAVAAILNIFSLIFLIVAIIFFVKSTGDIKEVDKNNEVTNITQQTKANDNLLAENKSLAEKLEAANEKLKQLQLSTDLSQVSTLYGQKKYVEAADKLISIPQAELSDDLKKKYDSMKGNILLKAANQLTIDGNALYGRKDFSGAIKKLEKVFTLGEKWTFGDKALYVLGKSYVEVNEIQKAIETYQKLIDEYPDSGYLKYAKSRLKTIM